MADSIDRGELTPLDREGQIPSPFRFDPSTIIRRTPTHPTRDEIVVMDPDFHRDPFDHYRWMHQHAPLYWDDVTGLWAATTHSLVSHVEADWQTFCSVKGSRPESSVPSMINLDPPEHTRRRRIVSSGFTPRRVAAHEEFLRATVRSLMDAVEAQGSCDFVGDIAKSIPLQMIAKLMGLPAADEDKLLHWSDLFATGGADIQEEVVAAVFEWIEYIMAEIAQRNDPEAEDLISLLLHHEGEPLTNDALVYETMLILVGGDETTRHVMSGGLEALLLHPDQLGKLQADRSLLDNAIEEMLRWVSPVRNMNRTATKDVELAGQSILAGDRVLLLYQAANRDPAIFEDPYRFDIERDNARLHVAFGGNGRHHCLGAQLARLELRVLFEEVLDRWPNIALVDADGPQPERRGNFVLGIERLPVTF